MTQISPHPRGCRELQIDHRADLRSHQRANGFDTHTIRPTLMIPRGCIAINSSSPSARIAKRDDVREPSSHAIGRDDVPIGEATGCPIHPINDVAGLNQAPFQSVLEDRSSKPRSFLIAHLIAIAVGTL